MSGSFQCPKCKASYSHDKRRVGKAVVCTCGHRFLVPPFDYAAPLSNTPSDASVTPRPRRATRPPQRAKPRLPKGRPALASDSSAEALPLAEPVEPAAPTAPTRWADPVQPAQPEPVMEAEVVEPGISYAEPENLAGDLFAPSGPYADPFVAGAGQPPLAARPLPSAPPAVPARKHKKKAPSRADGRRKRFSEWVAYATLFLFLPAAGLFTLIGLLQRAPGSGRAVNQSGFAPSGGNSPRERSTNASPPVATNEPPQSGYAITLWNAVKRKSGEFSVEYRQDRASLDSSRQCYWVVTDPSGRIEFPLPFSDWKQRGQLSGKTGAAKPGQFTGPYTMFIEEQVGSSRNRISNDVQVVAGP